MWSIGLTKNAGNWTWVSGRPLTICKWGKGEPSGENDAAFIYKRSSHGEQGVLAVVVEFGDKLIFVRFPRVGCFFVFVVVLFCFFVCLCYNIILSKLKDSRNA